MTDVSLPTPSFLAKLGVQSASLADHDPYDETSHPSTQTVPIYVPPLNFAAVSTNIYRSGFPRPENYSFCNSLGLRSILYLSDQDFREDTYQWAKQQDLEILHFRIESKKDPTSDFERHQMEDALLSAIDPDHWPILIHCNRGRHRVGLLCALIRRTQNWSIAAIFEEYKRFFGNGNSEGKAGARASDYEWIETFDLSRVFEKLEA